MSLLRHLTLLLLLVVSVTAYGQTEGREEEARDDLDYYKGSTDRNARNSGDGFGSQLWYGAGAQLGFQGGNGQSFFQIGVSPIVGYKITEFISVGPRGSIVYNSFAYDLNNGDRVKERWAGWSAGIFARAKVFQPFFAHIEYNLVSDVNIFSDGTRSRQIDAAPFFGGGISQGGGPGLPGYEILLLFRLTERDRLNQQPFELRTGLNFNF